MSTLYEITLTPLESFFFGSNKTFGPNNKDAYFVRSRFMPQQTTILGTLRYWLLQQNNLLHEPGNPVDKDAASVLIGPSSFVHSQSVNYGKIQAISPVMIKGPDGLYLTLSRDYALQEWKDHYSDQADLNMLPLPIEWMQVDRNSNHHPLLKGITPKSLFPDALINAKNGTIRPYKPMEGLSKTMGEAVFIPDEQVGITKKEKHEDGDAGFYKQVKYRMREGFSFVVYVEMEVDGTFTFEDCDLKMGADQSWFHLSKMPLMSVSESMKTVPDFIREQTNDSFHNINKHRNRIILLSDTWLPYNEYKSRFAGEAVFSSCDTLTFKHFSTVRTNPEADKQGEKKVFFLANKQLTIKKSEETRVLLKRGGVFFFLNKDYKTDALTYLNNYHPEYRKIGYNYAL
jgi:CRISPR-associated protein Cmr3